MKSSQIVSPLLVLCSFLGVSLAQANTAGIAPSVCSVLVFDLVKDQYVAEIDLAMKEDFEYSRFNQVVEGVQIIGAIRPEFMELTATVAGASILKDARGKAALSAAALTSNGSSYITIANDNQTLTVGCRY